MPLKMRLRSKGNYHIHFNFKNGRPIYFVEIWSIKKPLKIQRLEVIPAGFEPATHSLEGCCSIRLSYETIAKAGANIDISFYSANVFLFFLSMAWLVKCNGSIGNYQN